MPRRTRVLNLATLLVAVGHVAAPHGRGVDTEGDYTTAPDGHTGYKVHRVRPPLDGMRGRNDPSSGSMSDHNFDADHDLAPTNPRNSWALHHASALGDTDEVFRLLEGCLDSKVRNCNRTFYGVNVDAKESQFGKTALHRAAEHDRYDVAVELLNYNASVNVTDKYFWTPLHKTAEKGWLEFSRLLLAHDADVGAVDKYGWTPLHRACDTGKLAVAKLLYKNGANLNHGRAQLGHFFPDVHAYANQDGTPMHCAAKRGHVDVVKWLIEAGADIDARDKYGWVPLYYAAESGQLTTTEVLIAGGAQLNTRGVSGGTPLFIARANGHVKVHDALGRAGATYTTPLGMGLRSNLPTQSQDYSFNADADYIPARYGGNGKRYVHEGTGTYRMFEQPGLPSINDNTGAFIDESTGLNYRDEQHVGPQVWAPGATDAHPDAGLHHRYSFMGHIVDDAVDITPDPMSADILHASSSTDHGMEGSVEVHPGAPHIDDGYRQDNYRPNEDEKGFTMGGVDIGSRMVSRAIRDLPPLSALFLFCALHERVGITSMLSCDRRTRRPRVGQARASRSGRAWTSWVTRLRRLSTRRRTKGRWVPHLVPQ